LYFIFQFNNRELTDFENDLMIAQGTDAEVLIEGEEIVEVTDNPKQPVTYNQTQQNDSADSKQEAGSSQSSASLQKSTKKYFMKNRFTTYHERI